MNKHTSGPWENHGGLIVAPNIGVVGRVFNRHSHTAHGAGIDYEASKANASLFAAAPELLKQLKVAIVALESADEDRRSEDSQIGYLGKIAIELNKTIAKSEGK